METRETRYDDEITIDLAHMAASILKKWRSLLLITLVGAVLGLAWYLLPGLTAQDASQEQAVVEETALDEKLELAAMYRRQMEKLDAYVKNSVLMELDSQRVYTGQLGYYITETEDPGLIAAHFENILKEEDTRQALRDILQTTEDADIDWLVWGPADVRKDTLTTDKVEFDFSDATEKKNLSFGVFAPTREQAEQALAVLADAVARMNKDLSKQYDYSLAELPASVVLGDSQQLRDVQTQIVKDYNTAYSGCTTLETKFSADEKTVYNLYLRTGAVSSIPVEAEGAGNPLKKPVIVAFVFAFLAVAWYAVAYLLTSVVKTPDEAAQLTGRNVLALINTTVPAKCFIDRWLDAMENRGFPAAVPAGYAGAAAAKLDKAVVLWDTSDESLKQTAEALGVASMGLLGQDPQTLSAIGRENQVVLLVKLNATTKIQVRREADLCRQYGIPLAGSILVK